MPGPSYHFSFEQQKAFLLGLAQTGIVSVAAEMSGISARTCYNHREKNKTFAEAWDIAIEIATDELEFEARRRALEGVDEDVWHKGEVVGQKRKYSNTLLMRLLSANREKFKTQRTELTGKDGAPLGLSIVDLVSQVPKKKDTPKLEASTVVDMALPEEIENE